MTVRSLLAVALAAVLAPAAASAANLVPMKATRSASSTTGSGMEGLSVGGFIGYETDDLSGLSLRLDGELPFQALGPQLNLSWVGSLGYSRLTEDEGGVEFTANILKIIPAARLTFPVNDQFSLFADGGLGLYYASWDVEYPAPFSALDFDDSEFSILMRIGGGAFYQLNPNTRIGASIEFDPYFGDFDQTTFIIQAGAMFRL